MTYRKAKSIELYEAGIALATKEESYTFTAPTGRGEMPTRSMFKIPLVDIYQAAAAAGAETGRLDYQVEALTDQTERGRSGVIAEDYEINILRRIEDVGGETTDFEITGLEVEILGADLVNVKVTTIWNGEDKTPSTEEITYSGPFTVWWE